ncbi:ABC transporter permease subunit [Pseudonocardia sp. CA-142604]|uniref:branched-chain amino acid ABC transporter ATP-binding protein/permease n=1 Tax=Pseudonocardia sp. CA-142604 TaxID=3240024 RepID=UPI003D9308AE
MNIDLVNQILIMIMFAASLNLILGYTGQPTIAHAAFGAVGGYTAALFSVHLGVPFLLGLVLAIGVGYLFGALVSLPALALGSDWVILLTLAFAYIVNQLTMTLPALGGGYNLTGVLPISLFGQEITDPGAIFWVFLVISLLVVGVCRRLGESPFGRVLKGLREDEAATRSLGKNTTRFKVSVFALTSGIAGLAGACLVYYYSTANPLFFSLNQSIAMMSMVIIGGSGNMIGAIVGAILIQGSTPFLQNVVAIAPEQATFVQQVIYGLALVLVSILRPSGIVKERAGASLRGLLRRRGITTDPAAVGVPAEPATEHNAAAVGSAGHRTVALAGSGAGGAGLPALPPPPDTTPLPSRPEPSDGRRVVLRVTGLRKRFGGIVAVDGVDLELERHRLTALIGPNGAGKSTLFGLWTGFISPDEGRVELEGESIVGLTPDAVVSRGMVRSFQDTRLFHAMTVLENVVMAVPGQSGEAFGRLLFDPIRGRRDERRAVDQAMSYLETVGMAERAGVVAGSLGHGHQKLVAIARVLATDAPVLLLDEPTSGVDPAWVDEVATVVRRLPELGRTVCIVEHNLSFLEKLDAHCYFLEMGKVRSQGRLSALMADEELRHAYFGV